MTKLYIAPEVAAVCALHPYVGEADFAERPIHDQIAMQADRLWQAHQDGDRRIAMHVMCWWPQAAGQSLDQVLAGAFSPDDARLTMSREFGFADWREVEALGDLAPEADFERAVDTMMAGDLTGLEAMIKADAGLISRSSRYGHGATLLHYLAANGVESHRQVMPLNAVEIAKMLVKYGADRTATARMYGGGQTPLALASTSAHPFKAGLGPDLNAALTP